MLEQTQTILRGVPGDPGTFISPLDGRNTGIWLDPNVYEDMGSPEEVTITVQPGDRLN